VFYALNCSDNEMVMSKKISVNFVEMVKDVELSKKEKAATEAIRRFYPDAGPVKLYRTANGRVGFQMQIRVAASDGQRLERAYRAVMKILGERRGRRPGRKTVQTKLHLPEAVYARLKKAAASSHSTMSKVVAEALSARL
jgi:hypothetical protein